MVDQGNGIQLVTGENLSFVVVADEEEVAGYKVELDKQKKAVQDQISNLEKRLANKDYIKKAPAELVEQTKAQLATFKDQLENTA